MKKLLLALTVGFIALFGVETVQASETHAPNFKKVLSDLIAPNTSNLSIDRQKSLVAALESYELGNVGRVNSWNGDYAFLTLQDNSQYLIDRTDTLQLGQYVYIVYENDDLFLQIELGYKPDTVKDYGTMQVHTESKTEKSYGTIIDWYSSDTDDYAVVLLSSGNEYLIDYESGMLIGDYVYITYSDDTLYSQRFAENVPMDELLKLNNMLIASI